MRALSVDYRVAYRTYYLNHNGRGGPYGRRVSNEVTIFANPKEIYADLPEIEMALRGAGCGPCVLPACGRER